MNQRVYTGVLKAEPFRAEVGTPQLVSLESLFDCFISGGFAKQPK
jgi:hypothetical protein